MNEKTKFISSLTSQYDEGELQSMWRILIEDKLAHEGFDSLDDIIVQLKAHVPIQYITGIQYFYDRKFIVNKHVLIPRSETEELVDWILNDENTNTKTILDVGTGSGCIAILLKANRADWMVYGMDLSEDALAVARVNANMAKVDVNWSLADMTMTTDYPILADVIVCNPPYVLESDLTIMSESTKLFEPKMALYVEDKDPLKYYRAVIENTIEKKDVTYYFEIHHLLADEMKILCEAHGLKNIEIRKDMQGNDRMLKARKEM